MNCLSLPSVPTSILTLLQQLCYVSLELCCNQKWAKLKRKIHFSSFCWKNYLSISLPHLLSLSLFYLSTLWRWFWKLLVYCIVERVKAFRLCVLSPCIIESFHDFSVICTAFFSQCYFVKRMNFFRLGAGVSLKKTKWSKFILCWFFFPSIFSTKKHKKQIAWKKKQKHRLCNDKREQLTMCRFVWSN